VSVTVLDAALRSSVISNVLLVKALKLHPVEQ
jgi:hypothetical protein